MTTAQNDPQHASPGRAIETLHLTRCFGAFTAFDRVNFLIPYGGIFGLLGPNGAGKSTVIKMLTTLLKPSDWMALVAGFAIAQAPGEIRKCLGPFETSSAKNTTQARQADFQQCVFAREDWVIICQGILLARDCPYSRHDPVPGVPG
jgi:ABC-type oligopeptide transport system ATPase subunit